MAWATSIGPGHRGGLTGRKLLPRARHARVRGVNRAVYWEVDALRPGGPGVTDGCQPEPGAGRRLDRVRPAWGGRYQVPLRVAARPDGAVYVAVSAGAPVATTHLT